MNESEAREFLKTHRSAVMATIHRDGRPQLSNVGTVYRQDRMWVSITEDRVKYRNLVRDPRASLLILGDNFWQYLVVEGKATLIHMPEALPMLREYYRLASGEHPDWGEYDEAMAKDKRVLAEVSIERMNPLSG
jgi:PPOX class probable F420-dependent enzyme